jgi:hypothetical protein
VAVAGDLVYAARSRSGLSLFDVSDPSHPVELSTVPSRDSARALTIDGPILYLADGEGGVVALRGGHVSLDGFEQNGTGARSSWS